MNLMRAGHLATPGLDGAFICQGATIVHVFDTGGHEPDQPEPYERINVVALAPFSNITKFYGDIPVRMPHPGGRTFHLCSDCPEGR